MIDTPVKPPAPKTLKAWLSLLNKQPLPVFAHSIASLKAKLNTDNTALSELAAILSRDPVLCTHVLRQANAVNTNPDTFIGNLDHALSVMGTSRLKSLTEALPTFKPNPRNEAQYYYLRAIVTANHAALQAKSWAPLSHKTSADDVYWLTLLHNSTYWALWRCGLTAMRMIEYLVIEQGMPVQQAEQQQLGCSLQEICTALAKQWKLPSVVCNSFNSFHGLSHKEWVLLSQSESLTSELTHKVFKPVKQDMQNQLKRQINQVGFSITLAQQLCLWSNSDWFNKKTLRIEKIIAAHIDHNVSDTCKLIHKTASDASRLFPLAGMYLPATVLVAQPGPRVPISKPKIPQGELDTETITNVKQANATQRGNKEILSEFTDTLLNHPETFSDLHELMNLAAQGMHYGLGMERCMVALLNAERTRLSAFYSAGTKNSPRLAKLQLSLENKNLFTQLLKKPSSFWVNNENRGKVWPMLPGVFKEACQVDTFFLNSVFVGEKPVAVFYADAGTAGGLLNQQAYQGFKRFCSATNNAIQNMATRNDK